MSIQKPKNMIKVDKDLPASIVIGDLQIIETNEERDESKHVSVHLSIDTTIPFIPKTWKDLGND